MKTLTTLLFCLIGLSLSVFAADEEKKKAPKKFDPAKTFAKIDANSDSKVCKVEFSTAQKTMAKARAEKAGKADGFEAMWEKRSKGLEKRFAAIDKDSDGHLTAAEFAAAPRGGAAKGGKGKAPKKKGGE